MPQSKWERGFWAAVRGGGSSGFNPYPPEHWRPKKEKKVKRKLKNQKSHKVMLGKTSSGNYVKVMDIYTDNQLTLFD